MTKLFPVAMIIFASAAAADETRHLGAHEHGVGHLDIAFEGDGVVMELRAPGADIVGFEYAAESTEERAKLDAAVATLARPLDLFVLPAAAGCNVVQASAALQSDSGDADHDHNHQHDAHDHDDHGHEAQAKHADHDHEDHAKEAAHTEFHASYVLTCAAPAEVSQISFAYFATFPNARELEVQVVSDSGATAFEVGREAPVLDLRDMF